MLAYLQILRPLNGVMAALAVLVGALIAAQNLTAGALLAAIAAFIALGAGNVINDYYDYGIDRINNPSRPLPCMPSFALPYASARRSWVRLQRRFLSLPERLLPETLQRGGSGSVF